MDFDTGSDKGCGASSPYRIEPIVGEEPQWEPQFQTICRGELVWIPLRQDGYWLDPGCYTTGVIARRSPMSYDDAVRSITIAARVNGDNLSVIGDDRS